MLEFYAIALAVALLIVGPILYYAVPRVVRQLQKEAKEENLEEEVRQQAEQEYAKWLSRENEPTLFETKPESESQSDKASQRLKSGDKT